MSEPKEFKSILGLNALIVEKPANPQAGEAVRLAICNDSRQLVAAYSRETAAAIADEINRILGR